MSTGSVNTNRWVQLIASLIILLLAGIINATAYLVMPLQFVGHDLATLSQMGSTMLTFWPIGAIIGGKLLQATSGKICAIVGAVLFGLGLILTSFVPTDKTAMCYFTYSCLIGLGNGICYCGAIYGANAWFPDKKGLASGLCMAFNGGSSAFIAPLLAKITAATNIFTTLRVAGAVCAIVCVIFALFLKNAPVGYLPPGYKPSEKKGALTSEYESIGITKAVRTPHFWVYVICMALFPSFYIIMFSRLSLFVTQKGFAELVVLGVSVYNLGNVFGRLLLGILVDFIGYKKVYIISWVLCMIAGICMIKGNSGAAFMIAYVCLGAGFGSTNCVYPVMSNVSFGPVYAGNIYGFALLGYLVATQAFPRIAAATGANEGNYGPAFTIAFVCCTIAMIAGQLMPKPRLKKLNADA